MNTGLTSNVVTQIRDYMIQHSCTGGVPCEPPPPDPDRMPLQLHTEEGKRQLWDRLQNLNLGCVKYKLMHPIEGEGWDREKANHIEKLYKRFLYMVVTDSRPFMPTREIDEMWHAHMLDTIKYREDCDQLFGFFLDHFPYFGMRSDEDALNMVTVFVENCHRYEKEFGEPYAEIPQDLIDQIPQLRDPIDLSNLPSNFIGDRPCAA